VLVAYVDDSARVRRDDACAYALAGVLVDTVAQCMVREELLSLRGPRQVILEP
jgi:hypothetical protein